MSTFIRRWQNTQKTSTKADTKNTQYANKEKEIKTSTLQEKHHNKHESLKCL